jgi:hypothetical protein
MMTQKRAQSSSSAYLETAMKEERRKMTEHVVDIIVRMTWRSVSHASVISTRLQQP